MSQSKKKMLSSTEISQAFAGREGEKFSHILTVKELALLLRVSPKTIYEWKQKGYLEGTYRQQKKITLFWRDKAIDRFFNSKDWR